MREQLPFDRLVLWGLRSEPRDLHFIMQGFEHAAETMEIEVAWSDDEPGFEARERDLVFAYDGKCEHLPMGRCWYLLHNMGGTPQLERAREAGRGVVFLQVYTDDCLQWNPEQWDTFTYFLRSGPEIFQPWGTDLTDEEFINPVIPHGNRVYWVGSVWDHLGQGNVRMIEELKGILGARGLEFVHERIDGREGNIRLTRTSRVAPAFAGDWQVEHSYLPCRLFKNVSYGHLGLTNVGRFRELLGDTFVEGSLAEQIDFALGLDQDEWYERVWAQQERVKPYTYAKKLRDVARAIEEIY